MRVASKSDIGRVRNTNQDSFAAGEFSDAAWAVVCDGMGGANGGNVASGIAVKTISECILNAYHPNMKTNTVSAMLESAITAANLNIYDEALENTELAGMGTTVVAAVFLGDHAVIAHAGDSRAYICYNDTVRQLTRDHTVVQSMVERGEITQDEAQRDPRKHVITRALGVTENINIEFTEAEMPKGSVLLLCTDGLSNFVDSQKISDIMRNNAFEDYPVLLVDAANKAGGSDNITAVVITNNQYLP